MSKLRNPFRKRRRKAVSQVQKAPLIDWRFSSEIDHVSSVDGGIVLTPMPMSGATEIRALSPVFTPTEPKKRPFIAEITGVDPVYKYQRSFWGKLQDDTVVAIVPELERPKIMHIRASYAAYYLMYQDVDRMLCLRSIADTRELATWFQAMQAAKIGAEVSFFPAPQSPVGSLLQSLGGLGAGQVALPAVSNPWTPPSQYFGPPKAAVPAFSKPLIEPPVGKRRIKLG